MALSIAFPSRLSPWMGAVGRCRPEAAPVLSLAHSSANPRSSYSLRRGAAVYAVAAFLADPLLSSGGVGPGDAWSAALATKYALSVAAMVFFYRSLNL